jgi:hypothetical integral membrane protein (TIGR02206 family)
MGLLATAMVVLMLPLPTTNRLGWIGMLPDSLPQFQPFSPTHFTIVLLLTVLWGAIISWGVRYRGTLVLLGAERWFAVFYLFQWTVFHGWRLLPQNFHPASSWPLHVCDIVALLMPIALMRRDRFLMAILYFWGMGLSLQAILTPDLGLGPQSLMFWIFWLHHAAIVGVAIYMVVVHRYRPTRQDLSWTVGAGLVYLACVFPMNVVFDFNYGYVGNHRPAQPSLIDWLGPWPARVVVMAALAGLVMVLLLLPWELARCDRRPPEA